jgi:soluble lytic murein transglycosylase
MARAAVLLVAWGQGIHAKAFLGEADAQANDPAAHALAATLAVKLGLPDEAVAIARRSGREGRALVPVGWPRPVEPPNILPAPLLLGLIRQESAFDAGAVSPSGALGLMQLLPGTASEVARANQTGPVGGRLTTDPALNMLLGAAYLKSLIVRDGGNVPEAVASYNAGPHRVSGWPPPPASPPPDAMVGPPDAAMVDWIETIPVSETRNYVQRVLENWAVYAATGSNGGQG